METPFDGFWQVLFDDDDEDVMPMGDTTIAIRDLGCWVYAGGHYMELSTAKHREVVTSWPPDDELAAKLFKTNRSVAGRFSFEEAGDGFVIEHAPSMAVDPRILGTTYRHRVRIDGDHAVVHSLDGEDAGTVARWRRLSGRGSSPLAGAWTSEDEEEWWLYLVTAGHYGVMRSDFGAVAAEAMTEELTVAQAAALIRARSMNAGAHLMSTKTFDHWPMFATSAGYGATKHPTFYMPDIGDDEFHMAFERTSEGLGVWRRVG